MAKEKQQQSFVDDLIEGIRQLLDDLDALMNPDKKKQRARVPVPVRQRPDERDHRHNR